MVRDRDERQHAERIKLDVGSDRRSSDRSTSPIPATSTCTVRSELFSSDGDIWHRYATCAAPCPRVPFRVDCSWNRAVGSRPDLHDGRLEQHRVRSASPHLLSCPSTPVLRPSTAPGPACRVFQPGHYTGSHRSIRPRPRATCTSSPATTGSCNVGVNLRVSTPRNADRVSRTSGIGRPRPDRLVRHCPGPIRTTVGSAPRSTSAGDSRLRLDNDGSLEMFARRQGDFFVSVQALSSSTPTRPRATPGTDRALIRTRTVGTIHLVINGLVWSPEQPHRPRQPERRHRPTVPRRRGRPAIVDRRHLLGPASQHRTSSSRQPVATDAVIRLRSTSTQGGVTTTVEAVVEYRPQTSDVDQRVAVNSSRVVD